MPLKYTRSRTPTTQDEGLGDAPVISNETLRKKARYRLLGSVVLVVLGILGFTLMLDTQPRPNTADVTVLIPSRDKLPPLTMTPAPAPALASSAAHTGVMAPEAAASESLPAKTIVKSTAKSAASTASANMTTVPASASLEPTEVIVSQPKVVKNAEVTATKDAHPSDKGNTAESKKTKTETEGATDTGRYILQVGAFAEVQSAREVRLKLEHAGIKTYTQVIQNAEGRRIRVRVGPFDKRADAEKVAAKIRTLDLPAALLTL